MHSRTKPGRCLVQEAPIRLISIQPACGWRLQDWASGDRDRAHDDLQELSQHSEYSRAVAIGFLNGLPSEAAAKTAPVVKDS